MYKITWLIIFPYEWPIWYLDFYEEYWWKSVWKKITSDKLTNIDFLKIPEYFVLKLNDILEHNFNNLYWKDLIIKLSKKWDDFSDTPKRWQNSSYFLPKLKKFSWEKDLKEALSNINLNNVKSIILEEMVELDNNYYYIIVYNWSSIKIEISENYKNLWFYEINNEWKIINSESNNFVKKLPLEFWEKFFLNILNIHKKIYSELWIHNINTEWFFSDWSYIMVQIRPTPNEEIDKNMKFKSSIDFSWEIYNTNFVYWVFNTIWKVEKINSENYFLSDEKIFILDENIRYFHDLIIFRLENNLPTILLDLYDWFSLSHDKKYLPEINLRNNFKYISCIWEKNLLWKKVNLISNWEKWQVLFFNDNKMTDKFITDKLKSFNFTFKENDFNFPKDRVTSIAWVIFDENWDIVTIELDRWIDIPWGHIKIWETIKEALIRECREEAFIEIDDLKVSSIIESDYFWTKKEDLTYMLIFSWKLKKELLFQENKESKKRIYISPKDFLLNYTWNKEFMEKIIFNAINYK